MNDDITKKDLSMAYRRVQVGLPISEEDAAELIRRFERIKRRNGHIATIFMLSFIGGLLWYAVKWVVS